MEQTAGDTEVTGEQRSFRPLSAWLVLGILALPPLFAWFTLRSGYSTNVRAGALLYMGLGMALGLMKTIPR